MGLCPNGHENPELTSDGRCAPCRREYWRTYSATYERTERGRLLKHRRNLLRVRSSVDRAIAGLDALLKELVNGDSDEA